MRRFRLIRAAMIAAAMTASPAFAAKTFTVSGSFSDGGTLSGTFTTSDNLLMLESTALIVAGGTLGIDSVIFNEASYISAGTNSLPTSFTLVAISSVSKRLGLTFESALTSDGALLSTASFNQQDGSGTRTVTSGRAIGPGTGVGAVPEPSSWAMMISGFALAGTALRVRRRRNSSAKRLGNRATAS